MEIQNNTKINKLYLYSTVLLMFVLPVMFIFIDSLVGKHHSNLWTLIGKWFVFWSLGVRLLTAGLRQTINPSFTAKDIFHITDSKTHGVVKELGFANICLGTIAIVSFFVPEWLIAAAFAGGLFLGITGINHLIRKPSSSNEIIPTISNLFVFLIILIYILNYIFEGQF